MGGFTAGQPLRPGNLEGLEVELSFGATAVAVDPAVPVRIYLNVSDNTGGPSSFAYLGKWFITSELGVVEGQIVSLGQAGNRTIVNLGLDAFKGRIGVLALAVAASAPDGKSGFAVASLVLFTSRLSFGTFFLDLEASPGTVRPGESTFITSHASSIFGADLANVTVVYFSPDGIVVTPLGFTDGDGRNRVLFMPFECLTSVSVVLGVGMSTEAGVAIGATVVTLADSQCRKRVAKAELTIVAESEDNRSQFRAGLALRIFLVLPPPEPFPDGHNVSLTVVPSTGRIVDSGYQGTGLWQLDYLNQGRPPGIVRFLAFGYIESFPYAVTVDLNLGERGPDLLPWLVLLWALIATGAAAFFFWRLRQTTQPEASPAPPPQPPI